MTRYLGTLHFSDNGDETYQCPVCGRVWTEHYPNTFHPFVVEPLCWRCEKWAAGHGWGWVEVATWAGA